MSSFVFNVTTNVYANRYVAELLKERFPDEAAVLSFTESLTFRFD